MTLDKIKDHYEHLIIGAGITGAGIFRDLCLHDEEVLIIDKNDFTSQTSQSSSKMLHGGIRYLENFDFSLVYEALHEKNLWLKLTPHLAKERAFILPVYSDSKKPLWMLKIGLFLYDLLSGFQNTPHKLLTKNEVLNSLPTLRQNGLKGAGLYYDSVMDDAKITLEVIYDALKRNKKSHALNYVSFSSIKIIDQNTYQVELIDHLTSKSKTITTKNLIFSTGPFTDKVMGSLDFIEWDNKLLPSKGSHIYIKSSSLPVEESMVLMTKDDRIIFVIPNKKEKKILVGTTEVKLDEDIQNIEASQEEIDYLINCLKEYFPTSDVSHDDILSTFAGVRPLVKASSGSLGKTARIHQIFQPRSNIFAIIGGKYTTFRVMAADITKLVLRKKNKIYDPELSMKPLIQHSLIKPFSNEELTSEILNKVIENEYPRTLDDLIIRRMGYRSLKEVPSNFKNIINEVIEKLHVTEKMKEYWQLS